MQQKIGRQYLTNVLRLLDILPRLAHNNRIIAGSIGLFVVLWNLLVFSACTQKDRGEADRLNDMSYASHYSNLDSTLHYADSVLKLDIDDASRAEALNNIAFVDIMRMNYKRADSILNTISSLTDNQVELLIADIQQMRLCQRMSRNREFYDFRERAQQRISRIRPDALITEAVREPLEWIESDAERKSACDDIVKNGDRKQLMRLVGMLYRRRELLKDQKKHFHNVDAQYLKTAERMLHGELAYALGIAVDDVADYIRSFSEVSSEAN